MQDDEVEIEPCPMVSVGLEKWSAIDWNEPRIVWKHIGIPDSLHGLCELLGIIVRDDPALTHGTKKADYVPESTDFLVHLPLIDDPSRCVIVKVPAGIENDRAAWLALLTEMADFRVASHAKT